MSRGKVTLHADLGAAGGKRRLRKGREKVLVVEYSNTLTSVRNLASLLRNQKNLESVEKMPGRTLHPFQ